MADSIYLTLIYNVSLLLAMGLIYEVLVLRWRHRQVWLQHMPTGIILGLIGIAVMLTPWEFAPGIVYDTRSVLLGISGLFFGAAPTAMAMAMTTGFRIYNGGAGVLTGIISILASGTIGLAWRHWRRRELAEISWGELYIFGVVVHIAVLLAVGALPGDTARRVLTTTALPVMVIYPLGTAMLGLLMANLLRFEQTEDSLRESEERYRLLFNSINDAVYVFPVATDDKPGRFIEINTLAWKRLGYTREELLRLSPLDINALKDEVYIQSIMRRLQEEGQILLESRHLTRDGRAIPVEINARLFELKGRPTVLCIVRDNTERKRAEEEALANHTRLLEAAQSLEQSRNTLQLIIEAIPVRVFWKDLNLRYLGCNSLFARDAGLRKPEELLGKDDFVMGWKDQADLYQADDRQVMESRRPKLNILEPQTTPSGGTIWLNTSKVPLYTPEGEVFGVLGVYEDITARQEMEEALRESQAQLYEAHRLAKIGLWEWSVESDTATWSEELYEITGLDKHGPAPSCKEQSQFFDQENWELLGRAVTKALRNGEPYELELEVLRPDGGRRWVNIVGGRKYDSSQRVIGLHGTVQDITERKLAEEDKEKLENQLRQAQKMEAVGTLAAGIAHDFNNMLWAIMGFTELSLQQAPPDSYLGNNLQQVLKASQRAKDLVNQILTFSRKQEREKKPLQISLLIKEALKLLRATIPTTIEIKHDNVSPEATVIADPTQIHQLIVNLCANAAHAMRERGGVLAVRLEDKYLAKDDPLLSADLSPGPYVILTVSDTGHGMTPEIIAKIFDPFFTTKAVGEGSGMGLAVVYGIVKAHGGGIIVSSQPGAGASFTIVLPETLSPPHEEYDIEAPAPRGQGRLLIVDDEEALVAMTKDMLENLGYTVTAAQSSPEALQMFQARPDAFDLIITDQTMPHLTGLQLAQEIRRVRPDLPIILCTGYSDQVSAETIEAASIKELLMKPITLSNLGGAVGRALGKPPIGLSD